MRASLGNLTQTHQNQDLPALFIRLSTRICHPFGEKQVFLFCVGCVHQLIQTFYTIWTATTTEKKIQNTYILY